MHETTRGRAPAGIASRAGRHAAGARRRRYGLLLLSCLLLLGVQGMAPPGGFQQVIVAGLCGTSLLTAFRAADVAPRLLGIAGLLAGAALAVSVIRAVTGGVSDGVATAVNAALVALGPPAVALGVVRDLRATGRVRIEAVAGALSLYILLGMLFAFSYCAIDRLGNAPFFAGGEEATGSRCLYFSFITLTTVGYGDIVAATDLGRTLAVFEALLGQIYLVTVVALIVSNLGRPSRAERPPPRE